MKDIPEIAKYYEEYLYWIKVLEKQLKIKVNWVVYWEIC